MKVEDKVKCPICNSDITDEVEIPMDARMEEFKKAGARQVANLDKLASLIRLDLDRTKQLNEATTRSLRRQRLWALFTMAAAVIYCIAAYLLWIK